MDPDVAGQLHARARAHGVRVLLARRPGWRSDDRRVAFLAHTSRSRGWIERIDLPRTEAILDIDLAALDGDPPRLGLAHEALFLVCTNGRHDPCCADLGRPVVRALDAAGVPDVWETTHVGGDRFAANIVCLPTGVYLGRVDATTAADALDTVRRGVIPLSHYRGRSCFPPIVQAAESFARAQLGEPRVDALRLRVVDRPDEDEIVVRAVGGDGRTCDVRVRRSRADAATLTCTAADASAPWRYELVDLTTDVEDLG